MINNIDVTLRDGGYQNGFHFPTDYAIKHVQALVESGVEWIEIGYRNGSFKPIPDIGITGVSPGEHLEEVIRRAENVENTERQILSTIDAGTPLDVARQLLGYDVPWENNL